MGIYITAALAAYLVGSIPTGYLVARARGIDIRTMGSGNIGATNVFRILGKRAGTFVLLVDFAKGFTATALLGPLFIALLGSIDSPDLREKISIMTGVAAVLGHNYTCWLKFKGGKGIATSAGVLLAWVPAGLGVTFAVWLAVFALSRYVSLASITAAAALPFAVWLTRGSHRMIVICAVLGVLAIYKHRSNIQRLWYGTENRVGAKRA